MIYLCHSILIVFVEKSLQLPSHHNHYNIVHLETVNDVLCCSNYDERVVARFAQQIQSKYCGINISLSIEGISLEHFSALPNSDINSNTPSLQRHAVYHYFLSDGSKQDATTTITHSKRLISLLKDKKC